MTIVHHHFRRKNKRKIFVMTHRRKARISKRKRKAFTHMAKLPYEVGGQLDFENGNLDNAKVHFGTNSALSFEWNPDYEVSYHTHPDTKHISILPSLQDLLAMKETKEKEQIIFKGNLALSIAEKEKFESIKPIRLAVISRQMGNELHQGVSDRKIYEKFKPIFRDELGLDMKWHNPNKDIQLSSRSI